MALYIGCDAHRKFSVFVSVDSDNRESTPQRAEHDHQAWKLTWKAFPWVVSWPWRRAVVGIVWWI